MGMGGDGGHTMPVIRTTYIQRRKPTQKPIRWTPDSLCSAIIKRENFAVDVYAWMTRLGVADARSLATRLSTP